MKKVTFDSNVFQPIVRPDKFPADKEAVALEAIHAALRAGTITGLIAETMVDLEAIRRADRAAYFSGGLANTKSSVIALPGGGIKMSISLGPKPNAHPGVHPLLAERFAEAVALGVRFMHCPRIGLPRPALIQDAWFAPEADDEARSKRHDAFCSVGRAIEARGVGRAVVEKLGSSLAQAQGKSVTWFEGLGLAQTSQGVKQVADGVGEWADGDAVAAHIAYASDFFCTRDQGVSAGTSILTAPNRAWLAAVYGVAFVTPGELAASCNHVLPK